MMIRRWLMALLVICLLTSTVFADTMLLPSNLDRVESMTFEGCTELTDVVIPDGVTSIGDRSFADCTSLLRVSIPNSVQQFGEGCFDGSDPQLMVNCQPGSSALNYARMHQLDYDADTVCRALVICQTYANTSYAINGTRNDAQAVVNMLSHQTERNYDISIIFDVDAEGMLSGIRSAFAGATDRDISLIYYVGHGDSDGSLVGLDLSMLSPVKFKSEIARIPGRKVVVVDACYSGAIVNAEVEDIPEITTPTDLATPSDLATPTDLVSRRMFYHAADTEEVFGDDEDDAVDGADAFLNAFMGAFNRTLYSRALSNDELWVIAAAAADEESFETIIRVDGVRKVMGCFTYIFCKGCGWNGVADRKVTPVADSNQNGAVSIAEAFTYAQGAVASISPNQHAQTNGSHCTWLAPFR